LKKGAGLLFLEKEKQALFALTDYDFSRLVIVILL